ncbi:MAG: Do family serine endopeptidase [Acidobacteriaceae bacterium]|nr:Do family serine endopeptidase [Acidobacteriaceae bacterium]
MPAPTNKLIGTTARAAGIAGTAASLVLGAAFFIHHNGVHASDGYATPIDDSSVSALTSLDNAVETVAARVTPAVVNVAVTSRGNAEQISSDEEDGGQGQSGQMQQIPPQFRQFFGPGGPFGQFGFGHGQQPPQLEHGIGSGVIISPDGYIVTNNHVVDGATQIRVTMNDRRTYNAKLIGTDKLTDLAVIKIDGHGLPNIPWGDSSKLRPGQTVLAFGSPFGYFQFSVTRGIVSALDRPNPYADDLRKPGGFIQTDAAINPGNSGGPLVDAHGELVGINTFIITNSGSFAGAGFAIPSQIAHTVTEQLVKNGTVHHGYLGISMNDVTPDNYSFFKLQDTTGAIISQVTPDSPAAHAGLKSGDVIDSLNGKKIPNGSALQVAVSTMAPGTEIQLGIIRDGNPQTVNVKVGEFHGGQQVASADENGAGPNKSGKLGLAVQDLTQDVRQQMQIPSRVNGAVVANVRPGSPADDAGLAPGDVILEVDRKPVSNAEQFVNDVHANPGKDVLLLVWSHGNATYRVLHTDEGTQNGM